MEAITSLDSLGVKDPQKALVKTAFVAAVTKGRINGFREDGDRWIIHMNAPIRMNQEQAEGFALALQVL